MAGGIVRTYQVIRPEHPVAPRLPAVIFLHGVNALIGEEEARNGLLPAAASGQVVLIYPVGYGMSWDVKTCCGAAMDEGVDDMAFLGQVVDAVLAMPDVDPTRITLGGYSNGGKMAFRLSCARPGVFISLIIVNAVPITSCASRPPISLLEFAAPDDSELPYEPTDGPRTVNGVRLTPVVTQMANWRQRDGCETTPAVRAQGYLTTQLWSSCRLGARVELATYGHGGHDWQYGDGVTPGAGQIMWAFLTQLNQPT
jgi:polyhydroxybutyrate depolymerase